jgi:NAD(P)H-dependent FMN reductase
MSSSSEAPTQPLPTKKIALIVGSTRPVRVGPSVATFIKTILSSSPQSPNVNMDLSTVEVAAFNLPIFDEAVLPAAVPAHAQFANQHSKDWSAEIAKYDGYVVLSAEYNYSIPGALKNAIDYLYHTWTNKPVFIITYGIFGGKYASGDLKRCLEVMRLDVCERRVLLEFPGRDEAQHNMSPSLMQAMGGVLSEEAQAYWEESKKGEVLEGWKELVGKLEDAKA